MIIILVSELTPRIEYTMQLVFNEVMGVSYTLTTSKQEFLQSGQQKINYTRNKVTGCLTVLPADLLYESDLTLQEINTGEWNKLPIIFTNNEKEVPFDLFAAVFYLTTRYEEYLPYKPDQYGRFEADQSLAFKYNFLRLPIVDLWCQKLANELNINKYCQKLKPANYAFNLTIDIDQAWMIKYRGFMRNAIKLAREMLLFRFGEFRFKVRVILNKINDPGDSYDYLFKIQKKLSRRIRYFILSGGNHEYDTNIPIKNRKFRALIRRLDRDRTVGLHPSYSSNKSSKLLTTEYENLSEILGHSIRHSRQHFLKLTIPDTYRRLIKLGISEEHSMGYGSLTGFRAGIARSYFFYDLYEEKQTSLRIFPFQIMDRTLLSYQNLAPEDAIKVIKYYTDIIKSVGGNFIALWHNTSLTDTYEWLSWRKVFEEMIEMNVQA